MTEDALDIPTQRLTGDQLADLCGFRLPRESKFLLSRYTPPGPVGAAYIDSLGPIDAIMGPGGSGKTVASIWKLIRFAVAVMPVCLDGRIRVKGTVVRDTIRSMYRTTLQSWFDYFPVAKYPDFFGGQDRPATHRLQLMTVRMIGGVATEVPVDLAVEFFALQDVNYELIFKSYETSVGWATEADGVPHEAIPFFYSRTARYPRTELLPPGLERPRLMMVDFNPPDPDHPLLQACLRGSFKEDFDPAVTPKTVNFFRQPSGLSPQAENRAGKTLQAYQEEMNTMTRDKARRMVEGLPGRVKDGLPVYDEEFDYGFVSPEPLAILPDLPIHAGFDQDLTPAAVFFQETPDGQIRFLRECAPGPGTGVDRFLEQLLPILHGPLRGLRPGTFAADPAGFHGGDKAYGQLAWAEAMSQGLGAPVTPAPTNEWDLRRSSLSVIMRRSRRGGRDWPHMLIDPSMKMFIKGLAHGFKYQKQTNGFSRLPVKNEYSHVCEAGQYGVLAVRGVAGLVATIAQAGRPGRLGAPAQAYVAPADFSAFG